jgi:hypothetical protein
MLCTCTTRPRLLFSWCVSAVLVVVARVLVSKYVTHALPNLHIPACLCTWKVRLGLHQLQPEYAEALAKILEVGMRVRICTLNILLLGCVWFDSNIALFQLSL